jgi:hypothetical protein
VADSIEKCVSERDVALTPTQQRPIPATSYFDAYREVFPAAADAIRSWQAELARRHGSALSLDHYVMHVGARRPGSLRWVIADDLEQRFGAGLRLVFSDDRSLALGRVFENLVPA